MPNVSIFGSLTNIQMIVFTLLHGKRVGTDSFGNVYYRGKPRRGLKQERRWVMYRHGHDADTVPAEWHGWLHRQTNAVPAAENKNRRVWQKPPQANLTGSPGAYLPPSMKTGHRDKATGDYTAWQPPA